MGIGDELDALLSEQLEIYARDRIYEEACTIVLSSFMLGMP